MSMKLSIDSKNPAEVFGKKVYDLLVENFPQTFYVGGFVRDKLLGKKVTDIDIATSAKPAEVVLLLDAAGLKHDDAGKNFGVIKVFYKKHSVEIATFRTERYSGSRYPKVAFAKSPREDAKRRDFSINALYFKANRPKIYDFHGGLKDLKNKKIRFIGPAENRIKQDPLRLVRALRFCLVLGCRMENKSWSAVKRGFKLLENVSRKKLDAEIKKLTAPKKRQLLKKIIFGEKTLDKLSEKFYDNFK